MLDLERSGAIGIRCVLNRDWHLEGCLRMEWSICWGTGRPRFKRQARPRVASGPSLGERDSSRYSRHAVDLGGGLLCLCNFHCHLTVSIQIHLVLRPTMSVRPPTQAIARTSFRMLGGCRQPLIGGRYTRSVGSGSGSFIRLCMRYDAAALHSLVASLLCMQSLYPCLARVLLARRAAQLTVYGERRAMSGASASP